MNAASTSPLIQLLEEYLGLAFAYYGPKFDHKLSQIRLMKAVRDEILSRNIEPTPIVRWAYLEVFKEDPFPESPSPPPKKSSSLKLVE